VTIGKGTGWGHPADEVPPQWAAGDDELHRLVNGALRAEVEGAGPAPVVGLRGGTFWTMVGGPAALGRADRVANEGVASGAMAYPCDVLEVQADDRAPVLAVASVVARNLDYTRLLAVMNTQELVVPVAGRLRLGHRAHPGDGLIDVIDASLRRSELVAVARRARLGAYLPHPRISEERRPFAERTFDRRRHLVVDGVRRGRVTRLAIRVLPDRLALVV
jgi:diacylglycerol kinase family enzyme